MANSDDCNLEDNNYNSMRIPSHGSLPMWLENMSKSVIESQLLNSGNQEIKEYQIVDLNALKEATEIPSRISSLESSTLEKRYTKSSKSPRFGRSSFISQVSKGIPRHMKITDADYIIPRVDIRTNYADLCAMDEEQFDLEKSWKGLVNFDQTHKGRLDSAQQQHFRKVEYKNKVTSPITSSEIDFGSCYSPSFIDEHVAVTRSKSEMSNYLDPTYQLPTKRKRRPSNDNTSISNSLFPNFNNLSISKSKSSENLFHFFPKDDSDFGRPINDYKMKVNQEIELRDKIINELFSENERITERMKSKNVRKKYEKKSFSDFDNSAIHHKWINESLCAKGILTEKTDLLNSQQKDNLSETFEESLSTFVIPELPTGKILSFNILSTWGDKHYVGLNGIEIYGSDGKLADVKKITANPSDINVLHENKNDPRVITNLLDGVNRTQDDVHLWLAPFEQGLTHIITIQMRNVTTIAMIRIWNYNKSRIHSYRGVRNMVISLDSVPIFKGEIVKACGGVLGGVDAFADTILFTTDDKILEHISHNDNSFSSLTRSPNPNISTAIERPPTVATRTSRPYTGAPLQGPNVADNEIQDETLFAACQIDLVLLSNWGYTNVIGLTGIEVVGPSNDVISLKEDNIKCTSRFTTINLKALINGENVTINQESMCWIPFRPTEEVAITIKFPTLTYISGLRIWNYNHSAETSYLGVQTMQILLDNKPLMNDLLKDHTFLLRRAPGNVHYDYVQEIFFANSAGNQQDCVPVNQVLNSLSLFRSEMPEGFVFQFIIFSTWGDPYYCGLNQLELYNEFGIKVNLSEQNVCAYPESINVLPGVCGDVRTPDKLIDNIYIDDEGAHSWLAPIIPQCLNRLYIVLDNPATISIIKLWNYSKTPSRGVKEFSVLVDDLLIYSGVLDKYSNKKGSSYRSILFTEDKSIIEKEANTYIRRSSFVQDVVLYDEKRTTTGGSLPNADQSLRPFTSVSSIEQGYISQ